MTAMVMATFVAAIVVGALGYGFSSIAVPIALLAVTSRMLNPALVLVEVVLNVHLLWINRAALARVWRRAGSVVIGLPVGIALGTAALTSVDPAWLKLDTFIVLLPLILLQAAGFRRPIRREVATAVGLGAGVGFLYAITTISGPPLALFLTNQGMANREFRAALAAIRVVAACLTTALYGGAGLFTSQSMSLLMYIVPSVVVGIPIGMLIIQHVEGETFRRICMTFDAAIVAFGVSTSLRAVGLVPGSVAYLPFIAVLLLDAVLIVRYFRKTARKVLVTEEPRPCST
jgi:uncharacterized membrane protein YfcA